MWRRDRGSHQGPPDEAGPLCRIRLSKGHGRSSHPEPSLEPGGRKDGPSRKAGEEQSFCFMTTADYS